jgi:hypothetical protein
MAEAVYAIDDFPADDLLWRIEWIGGVGYNTNVPSDRLIDVCLAQLPVGETNPLSARSRSSQTKRTVRIGIGLLPYISIASVWRRHRPVPTNLAASRHRLRIDTSSCRMVPLADLANTISKKQLPFWCVPACCPPSVGCDEIGRPRGSVPGRPIWCGIPDCNVFKSKFAQFSGNNRVHAGVVDNHVSLATPANRTSWCELQRGCHELFFAPNNRDNAFPL